MLDCRDFVAVYFSEGRNLSKPAAAELRRFQRAYTQLWAGLLSTVMPGVPEKEARIRVHAAYAVVNDIALASRFLARTAQADELRRHHPGRTRPRRASGHRSMTAG